MVKFTTKYLWLLIGLTILTGCATTQSVPEPKLEVDPNSAIIILNRPKALIAAWTNVPVYANGKHIGEISNGGELKWKQREGILDLSIGHSAFADSGVQLRHEVKKGEVYTLNYKFNSFYGPSEIELVGDTSTNNNPEQVNNLNIEKAIPAPEVDNKEITETENTKEADSSSTIEERLLLVKQMYNDGLITKEEYDMKRKEIVESF